MANCGDDEVLGARARTRRWGSISSRYDPSSSVYFVVTFTSSLAAIFANRSANPGGHGVGLPESRARHVHVTSAVAAVAHPSPSLPRANRRCTNTT